MSEPNWEEAFKKLEAKYREERDKFAQDVFDPKGIKEYAVETDELVKECTAPPAPLDHEVEVSLTVRVVVPAHRENPIQDAEQMVEKKVVDWHVKSFDIDPGTLMPKGNLSCDGFMG
jgi:hypothetical protein